MSRTYRQWLLDRRIALDALDDQFPAPTQEYIDGAHVATFMQDSLLDHMTDAGLSRAAGLHEGVAEMASEYFGLYEDDDDFSIPAALADLAVLVCERIDGARDRVYPRLPAQQVPAYVPDAGDAPDAPSAAATKAVA